MKVYRAADRARLQHHIWEYERRRDVYRKKSSQGLGATVGVNKILTREAIRQINEMRTSGATLSVIANTLGVSKAGASRVCNSKNTRGSRSFKEMAERCQRKIDLMRRMIIEIDKRNNKIIALGNEIAYFTGYNVKNAIELRRRSDKSEVAKGIFCKWGMENGLQGVLLGEYMGTDRTHTAPEIRSRFTKSFKDKPENKELWLRFKQHYLEIINDLKSNKHE